MNKQEFNGRTLDEALSAAARALGTDVTMISYNILPQNSGGLFSKLFQRGVRLEAWVDSSNDVQAAAREAVRQAMADAQDQTKTKNQKAQLDRPAPIPREHNRPGADKRKAGPGPKPQQAKEANRGPRPTSDKPRAQTHPQRKSPQPLPSQGQMDGDVQADDRIQRPRFALNSEESKALLVELAKQFTHGFDPEVTDSNPQLEFVNEEEVLVTIHSPTLEGFLQRSDRLSCAFEHLFKRIAQRKFGDVSGRVTLDAGSAAQQREDKLKQMALDIAAKVKENGKTITLSSKSSQERRVIHLALENMEGIATKSVGVAENRKLIIYSTERPRRDENGPRRHHDNQRRRGRSNATGDETFQSADGQSAASGSPNERSDQPRRNRRRGRRGGSRNGRNHAPRAPQNQDAGPVLNEHSEHSRDSEV